MRFKNTFILGILFTSILFSSCRKTAEKMVDCFGQSFLASFHHKADASNSRKIDFTVNYSGKLTVTSVKFEYGDGQSETVTGTTSSHTYNTPGSYAVKARISLKNGNGTCGVDPVRQVVVE